MISHDRPAQGSKLPSVWRYPAPPCLPILAALCLLLDAPAQAGQTTPPSQAEDRRPAGRVQLLDLSAWTVEQTGTGSAALRPSPDNPSVSVFQIDSDGPSTVSLRSAPLEPKEPYRVTFWLRAPRAAYKGFTVYDARDQADRKTDIRVFLHTSRKGAEKTGGWHGALWVRDAKAAYSVAEVPRKKWMKLAVERRKRQEVALFVDDALVGTFVARGATPLARIGSLGETDARWKYGNVLWGPAELSAPPAAWSSAETDPSNASAATKRAAQPRPTVSVTVIGILPDNRNKFTPIKSWADLRNTMDREVTARVEFRLDDRAEPIGSQDVAIPPGRTVQVEQPLGTLTAGAGGQPRTYRLTVTLAPEPKGDEAGPPAFDASAQSRDLEVGAAPDLTVVSVKVTPAPLKHGEEAVIETQMTNLGGGQPIYAVEIVAKWPDGNETVIERTPIITSEKSLVLKTRWRALRNHAAIVVRLDPRDEVAETDEENNVASRPIEVVPPSLQVVHTPSAEPASSGNAEIKFGTAPVSADQQVSHFEKVEETPVLGSERYRPFSKPPIVVTAGGAAANQVSEGVFRLTLRRFRGKVRVPWLAVVPSTKDGIQAGSVAVKGPTRILFERPFANVPVVITSARQVLPPVRDRPKRAKVQPVTSFARSPDREGFELVVSHPDREPYENEVMVEYVAVDTKVATDFIGGIEVIAPDAGGQLKKTIGFGGNFDNEPLVLSSALYEEAAVSSWGLNHLATGVELRAKRPKEEPAGPALVQWLAYNGKDDFWVNPGVCAFEWGEPDIALEEKSGIAEFAGNAEDGLRAWAFAKADAGAKNDTKDFGQASLKAMIHREFQVIGMEGQDCVGRVRFQAGYTGLVDLFDTGATPLGAATGNYGVEVSAGVERWQPERSVLENRPLWWVKAHPEEWARDEIAIAAFDLTRKPARAVGLGLKILGYLRGRKRCDEEVDDSLLVQFDHLSLRAGETYRVFLRLHVEVKEVAIGHSVGYTEVDFLGKEEPDNCNKNSLRLRDKGVRLSDTMLRLRPAP